MTNPPRIERKELKGPDAFVRRGSSIVTFLVERRSFFVVLLSVSAIGIVAFYGIDHWRKKRLETGWNALLQAQKLEESQRWDGYKKVYETHSNIRPGFIAALRVADHFFDESRKLSYQELEKAKPIALQAAEWYLKARGFSGLLPTEKQLLGIDYGLALELSSQVDLAISEYRVASEIPGDARAFALLKLGGAYESQGNRAQAEAAYQKITVDFSSSDVAPEARNGIRRLKSPNFGAKS